MQVLLLVMEFDINRVKKTYVTCNTSLKLTLKNIFENNFIVNVIVLFTIMDYFAYKLTTLQNNS